MISILLEKKIKEAYSAIDEAYVQAQKDSFLMSHTDKQTLRSSKALGRCSEILDKLKEQDRNDRKKMGLR